MEIIDDVHNKPLRIVVETHPIKKEKVLMYVKGGCSEKKAGFVDTIIGDLAGFSACSAPTYVIIKTNDKNLLEKWKKQLINNKTVVIFTTLGCVKGIREKFKGFNIQLISGLHKRHNFPTEINEAGDIDAIVQKIAEVMRYRKLVTDNNELPPIYLIQQFFNASDPARAKEFETCLKMNVKCSVLDKIILLNESDDIKLPLKSSKIECVNIGHRMGYIDVFKYIKESVPDNVIVLFANSDIFLMDDFKDIHSINMEKKFLALLRWDTDEKGMARIFGPRPDSQDVWGVLSSDIKTPEFNLDSLNFLFGMPGCDNAITAIMRQKGFYCINPALSLKSYHLHNTQLRNYSNKDRVYNREYLYLEPTELGE
jgi:hypothetical protein